MNKAKKDELKLSRETRTVQILGFEDESSGALMPPVHFATTFARDAEPVSYTHLTLPTTPYV